jgi:VCBS repeat-containing protein
VGRTVAEDNSYTVTATDLGFADADAGQTLAAVRIDTLATNGVLQLNGVPVTAGQVIPVAAINAGQLKFVPDLNENGTPYGSFTFSVQDSAGAFDAVPNTFTLNVTPVNDAPVGVADTATAVEAGGVSNGTAGTNPTGNVLTNDTDVDTGDTKAVSAVTGTAAGTVGGTTAGQYGSLVLNADGSYTYTVNNALPAVQALRTSADTLTDTFTYTVRDTAGLTKIGRAHV